MTTVLEIAQGAAYEMGVTPPISLISTGQVELQWKHLLYSVARDVRAERAFPQQKRTHSITLAASRGSYPLPDDFFSGLIGSQYDQTNGWELIGPVSDANWNYRLYGPGIGSTRLTYRVFGPDRNQGTATAGGQLRFDPTPTATGTIGFDYISANTFLPPAWTASEVVSSGTYRNANGNIYRTNAGGTGSTTPPSHTTGNASENTIVWTYITATYDTIITNSDISLFDDDVIVEGLKYKYYASKGIDYTEAKGAFISKIATSRSRWVGNYRGRTDMAMTRARYVVPSGGWSF